MELMLSFTPKCCVLATEMVFEFDDDLIEGESNLLKSFLNGEFVVGLIHRSIS
jgi:hypothetical protein